MKQSNEKIFYPITIIKIFLKKNKTKQQKVIIFHEKKIKP